MEPTPEETTEQIGLVGRMLRVFYAPRETFEAVRDSRATVDWFVPTVVVALVSLVAASAVMPFAMEEGKRMMEKQMQGQEIPAEQREMMESMASAGQTAGLVMAPVSAFIGLFAIALLLLGIGKIIGAELGYSGMLVVTAYSSLINIVKAAVVTPLMVSKETLVVHTGLGLLLPDELLESFVGRALADVEIFMFWQVCIAAIGISVMGNVESRKAFIPVVVLWVIAILIFAAFAGLGPGG